MVEKKKSSEKRQERDLCRARIREAKQEEKELERARIREAKQEERNQKERIKESERIERCKRIEFNKAKREERARIREAKQEERNQKERIKESERIEKLAESVRIWTTKQLEQHLHMVEKFGEDYRNLSGGEKQGISLSKTIQNMSDEDKKLRNRRTGDGIKRFYDSEKYNPLERSEDVKNGIQKNKKNNAN